MGLLSGIGKLFGGGGGDDGQAQTEGTAFLEANAQADGVTTTDTGLQYKVLKAGTGDAPNEYSTVTVHYEGKLIDGTVFDSTDKRAA